MKVIFKINYRTSWGESLHIYGDPSVLGGGDSRKAVPMEMVGADMWQLVIDKATLPETFTYQYVVKTESGPWRMEWGIPHRFVKGKRIRQVVMLDHWHDVPHDKPYYSSAIVRGIYNRMPHDLPIKALPGTVQLRVIAPMVAPNQVVALAGNCRALGNWDPQQALRFNDARYPVWEMNIPADEMVGPVECKFLILDKDSGEVVSWENRDNRVLDLPACRKSEQVVYAGEHLANPFTRWKAAGTAIPVFSIRTEEDFGVGDFADLKQLVDWCRLTGQKILQLLPINDTTLTGTWLDSYPYRANSTFALHPMYLSLPEVGKPRNRKRAEYYENLRRELNALPEVDYERVNNAKEEYMREIYAEQGKKTAEKTDYKEFVERNASWLYPYAAWNVLRRKYGTPENARWERYRVYSKKKVDAFIADNADEIGFYLFVQYHLDRQLRDAVAYARSHQVVLKGDIPIGIGRDSVDAWMYPNLFNMNSQAGAPPDDFSVLGQNWGFPTYNWEEMGKDGFAWWKARFKKMAEYFDAYRIDHVLGFFRIWQIPLDALHGLLGIFNPALPFTPEELRDSYDFHINPDVHTRPLILEWMLTDFFGEYTEEAKHRFLTSTGVGQYKLKQFVDSQAKVAHYFSTLEKDDKNTRLSEALCGLVDDVLFIEDPEQKGKYHPRISAQFTYQYRVLSDYEKWCFNRLYNDFFYRRHNDFWYGKAMWKLPPLLDATSMLTCAEDLGMIPACVPSVMERLRILSLEIQRMPKDPQRMFGDPATYPYLSVCTTSTHDMPGIRGWWESDRSKAQRFYNEMLHEHGEAPYFAEPWICNKIIDQHLWSPSMLCILPLQDWLSIDMDLRRNNPAEEEINVPANPKHYWRYRMHINVCDLMKAEAFNDAISYKIRESGR